MRKQQLFPFLKKRFLSVGKIENLLSQYSCYVSAICHNLVLLTFLSFGPIYRRNKSGRLEVRVSVHILCVWSNWEVSYVMLLIYTLVRHNNGWILVAIETIILIII